MLPKWSFLWAFKGEHEPSKISWSHLHLSISGEVWKLLLKMSTHLYTRLKDKESVWGILESSRVLLYVALYKTFYRIVG